MVLEITNSQESHFSSYRAFRKISRLQSLVVAALYKQTTVKTS